jgi:hypothetical protein
LLVLAQHGSCIRAASPPKLGSEGAGSGWSWAGARTRSQGKLAFVFQCHSVGSRPSGVLRATHTSELRTLKPEPWYLSRRRRAFLQQCAHPHAPGCARTHADAVHSVCTLHFACVRVQMRCSSASPAGPSNRSFRSSTRGELAPFLDRTRTSSSSSVRTYSVEVEARPARASALWKPETAGGRRAGGRRAQWPQQGVCVPLSPVDG